MFLNSDILVSLNIHVYFTEYFLFVSFFLWKTVGTTKLCINYQVCMIPDFCSAVYIGCSAKGNVRKQANLLEALGESS